MFTRGVFTRFPYQVNTHGLPAEVVAENLLGFVEATVGEGGRALREREPAQLRGVHPAAPRRRLREELHGALQHQALRRAAPRAERRVVRPLRSRSRASRRSWTGRWGWARTRSATTRASSTRRRAGSRDWPGRCTERFRPGQGNPRLDRASGPGLGAPRGPPLRRERGALVLARVDHSLPALVGLLHRVPDEVRAAVALLRATDVTWVAVGVRGTEPPAVALGTTPPSPSSPRTGSARPPRCSPGRRRRGRPPSTWSTRDRARAGACARAAVEDLVRAEMIDPRPTCSSPSRASSGTPTCSTTPATERPGDR